MANKDAYWFPHDSNASRDEKMIALRMKLGWEGCGLFWALIEKLRDSSEYKCAKDYNLIAFDLRTDAAKIKSIVEEFGLFVFTECGKYFYSERLTINMLSKEVKSNKAKESAANRWSKNANAMRTHNERNASAMLLEEKRKEENREDDKSHVQKKSPPATPSEINSDPNYHFSFQKAFRTNEDNAELALNDDHFRFRASQLGLKTPEHLKKAMHDFVSMRNAKGKTQDNIEGFRSHFDNWIKKAIPGILATPTAQVRQMQDQASADYLERLKQMRNVNR